MPLPKTVATAEAHFEANKDRPVDYPRWVNRKKGPPVQAFSESHEEEIKARDEAK